MISAKRDSRIERRPRAPIGLVVFVLFPLPLLLPLVDDEIEEDEDEWGEEDGDKARSAMAWRAPVVNFNWIPYVLNKAVNCFTREFLGEVRMVINWVRLSGDRATVMGIRPKSSGIKP